MSVKYNSTTKLKYQFGKDYEIVVIDSLYK